MRTKAKELQQRQEAAQSIEYALIVAVLSVTLALVLLPALFGGQINNFIGRLGACISSLSCA